MKPGEFVLYLIAGEMVRRKCWPTSVFIYYSNKCHSIFRVNTEDFSSRVWEPTTKDLMAEDWELSTEIYE